MMHGRTSLTGRPLQSDGSLGHPTQGRHQQGGLTGLANLGNRSTATTSTHSTNPSSTTPFSNSLRSRQPAQHQTIAAGLRSQQQRAVAGSPGMASMQGTPNSMQATPVGTYSNDPSSSLLGPGLGSGLRSGTTPSSMTATPVTSLGGGLSSGVLGGGILGNSSLGGGLGGNSTLHSERQRRLAEQHDLQRHQIEQERQNRDLLLRQQAQLQAQNAAIPQNQQAAIHQRAAASHLSDPLRDIQARQNQILGNSSSMRQHEEQIRQERQRRQMDREQLEREQAQSQIALDQLRRNREMLERSNPGSNPNSQPGSAQQSPNTDHPTMLQSSLMRKQVEDKQRQRQAEILQQAQREQLQREHDEIARRKRSGENHLGREKRDHIGSSGRGIHGHGISDAGLMREARHQMMNHGGESSGSSSIAEGEHRGQQSEDNPKAPPERTFSLKSDQTLDELNKYRLEHNTLANAINSVKHGFRKGQATGRESKDRLAQVEANVNQLQGKIDMVQVSTLETGRDIAKTWRKQLVVELEKM